MEEVEDRREVEGVSSATEGRREADVASSSQEDRRDPSWALISSVKEFLRDSTSVTLSRVGLRV